MVLETNMKYEATSSFKKAWNMKHGFQISSQESLSSDSESETVVLSQSFSMSIDKRPLKYSLNFELSSLFAKVIIEDTKVLKCSTAFFFLVVVLCSFVAHKEAAETKSETVLPFNRFQCFVTIRDPLEAVSTTTSTSTSKPHTTHT